MLNLGGKVNYQKHIENISDLSEISAEVKIDGTKWKSKDFYLTDVFIDTSTGFEASTCDITFKQPKADYTGLFQKSFDISDDFAKVKVGVKLEVSLGFEDKTKSVFVGYVSAFDVEIKESTAVIVTIRGMDAKVWLMASCKTAEYKEKKKYSDIVTEVFKDYSGKFSGKEISIESEQEFETQIYQRNESDYEVICRAACKVGALFFVSLGKFFFISPTVEKSTQGTISPGLGVLSAKTTIDVWGIPKEVVVKFTNPKNFEEVIEGKATTSEGIGGGKTATSVTSNINNVFTVIDNTLSSKAQADFLAKAEHAKRNLHLVKTNLTLLGIPDIKLAEGLTLKNFGDPIDNDYIVTGLRHEMHFNKNERVYKTYLTLSASKFNPKT